MSSKEVDFHGKIFFLSSILSHVSVLTGGDYSLCNNSANVYYTHNITCWPIAGYRMGVGGRSVGL